MELAQPDEVYNLGAISFVSLSWKQAELTGEITGLGVLRMLEPLRIVAASPVSRSACRTPSASARWTRAATGASPATTSRRCG
jgi:GDPmannose 4,6-dehydratase